MSMAVNQRLDGATLDAAVARASGRTVTYDTVVSLFIVGWIVAIACNGGYQQRRLQSLWYQAASVWRSSLGVLAVLGVSGLFLRLQFSRSFVLVGLAASVVLTMVARTAVIGLFMVLQRVGIGVDRVVLVGSPTSTHSIRSQLETTSSRKTRVVDEVRLPTSGTTSAVLAPILRVVDRHGATSVVMCGASALPTGTVRALAAQLAGTGVSLVVAPGTAEAVGPGVQLHPVGDLFLLRVRDSEPGALGRVAKAVLDRSVALLMLVALAPLMLVLAVAIRRGSPGPALFRQDRVGRRGRMFRIYKFRSMTDDAEARLRRDGLWETYVANGYKLPQGQDPRVTRLGALMRRTSLDELPQLFNVLNGTMSMVGPRPVVPSELACYGDLELAYTGVRPGITGYWQVNGRSDVGFPERAELDAYYYDNRSLRVDLRILFRTVVAVAMRVGAH
jgi:exopolysaccharide biosynthesis polyprenyl glycosylphosphotransferase